MKPCVRSQDSIKLRTSTWPSPRVGASVSTKLKSLSWIAPCGRRASSHWRFFMSVLLDEWSDLHITWRRAPGLNVLNMTRRGSQAHVRPQRVGQKLSYCLGDCQAKCLRLCQVRVFVEERDFVRVGHCDFTLASFAPEVSSGHEPGPVFD